MKNTCLPLMLFSLLAAFSVQAEENAAVNYPDPQRWNDKINEFRQWDSKNAVPKDAILFYGSSSIVYWKTADSFPGLPVINRGFGGSVTADAVYFVEEMAIKYQPKVVVIYEGDNDVAGSITPKLAHRDFVTLAGKIHAALPDTEIICLPAKLCQNRWHLRDKVNELNHLNQAYAETQDYLTFVDTVPTLLGPDGLPVADYFLPDQLHLNDKGYARWNALLAPVIHQRYAMAMKKTP